MPDDQGRVLEQTTNAFACCPLCSAEGTFETTGHRLGAVRCTACKAEWNSEQFGTGEELRALKLMKPGKNRDLGRGVITKVPGAKTVAWWRLARTDPRATDMGRLVTDLLYAGYAPDIQNPLDPQSIQPAYAAANAAAVAELDRLGPLGRAEIEGMADGIHYIESRINADPPGEWREREWALDYLAERGDHRWIEFFRREMWTPDDSAAGQLVEEARRETKAPESVRMQMIGHAVSRTVRYGNDALIPDIAAVLARDRSAAVRINAAMALRRLAPDPRAVDALGAALSDGSTPPDDPILAGSWTDFVRACARAKRKASVGEVAAVLLSEIDDPLAATLLVEFAVEDREGVGPWAEIIRATGPRAVGPLLDALESKDARHRARAAAFFGLAVPDPRGVEPLIRLMSDADSLARRNAAFALGRIGDRRAVESLQRMAAGDEEDQNRGVAGDALATMPNPA